MQTSNENYFFQSDEQVAASSSRQAKAKHAQSLGDPIQLGVKPLYFTTRGSDEAWVGDASGAVRCVNLEQGKVSKSFSGHSGPVTCVAFTKDSRHVISSSWDKSFRIHEVDTQKLVALNPDAHSDFIKTILVVDNILITAGTDREIRFWDLDEHLLTSFAAPSTLPQLQFLRTAGKEHTRPIERLAWTHITLPSSSEVNDDEEDEEQELGEPSGSISLWSADSMGMVIVWELSNTTTIPAQQLQCSKRLSWKPHETGIYDLVINAKQKQIWTASADKSVLLSSFDPTAIEKQPVALRRIQHPYYVRSVLPIPPTYCHSLLHLSHQQQIIVTGSTDEAIRVWKVGESDMDDDDEQKNGPIQLINTINAHFDEVNELKLWHSSKTNTLNVLSMSLDATIRKWNLTQLPHINIQIESNNNDTDKASPGVSIPTKPSPSSLSKKTTTTLTEEEERELAELMDD